MSIINIDIDIMDYPDTREPYNMTEEEWLADCPELIDMISEKISEWEEHLIYVKRKAATLVRRSDSFPTALQRWMFGELVKIRLSNAEKRARRNLRRLRLIRLPYIMVTPNNSPIPGSNTFQDPYKDSITDQDIQRAKDHPIQELYLGTLRFQGRSSLGLCPIHDEKTPSFRVYEDNTFHCFGCAAHGDTIDLIMKTKGVTFIEAVKLIKGLN